MPASVLTIAENFKKALHTIEESRDVEPLIALFSEEATLSRLGRPPAAVGREEAREFWRVYLANFQAIRSEFSATIATEDAIVLEWLSHGQLPDGEEFTYGGVSLLSLDAGGLVRHFRTYYDSAALEHCAA